MNPILPELRPGTGSLPSSGQAGAWAKCPWSLARPDSRRSKTPVAVRMRKVASEFLRRIRRPLACAIGRAGPPPSARVL